MLTSEIEAQCIEYIGANYPPERQARLKTALKTIMIEGRQDDRKNSDI